jgi:hypothetical protein
VAVEAACVAATAGEPVVAVGGVLDKAFGAARQPDSATEMVKVEAVVRTGLGNFVL